MYLKLVMLFLFSTELTTEVIPYADSLGMNEQELPNLYSMLKFGNITLASDSNPRIAVVLGTFEIIGRNSKRNPLTSRHFSDQMRQLFQVLGSPNSQRSKTAGLRPLTRLHVHTLAYQAIVVKRGSSWKNTRIAAAKASLTANRHVCASKWIDLDKVRLGHELIILLQCSDVAYLVYYGGMWKCDILEMRIHTTYGKARRSFIEDPVLYCLSVFFTPLSLGEITPKKNLLTIQGLHHNGRQLQHNGRRGCRRRPNPIRR